MAKATFYRHFPSKDDVVIAFLERREERWTRERIEKVTKRRGATPEQSLLAIPRRENRSSAVWTIRSSARWEASSPGLGTPRAKRLTDPSVTCLFRQPMFWARDGGLQRGWEVGTQWK